MNHWNQSYMSIEWRWHNFKIWAFWPEDLTMGEEDKKNQTKTADMDPEPAKMPAVDPESPLMAAADPESVCHTHQIDRLWISAPPYLLSWTPQKGFPTHAPTTKPSPSLGFWPVPWSFFSTVPAQPPSSISFISYAKSRPLQTPALTCPSQPNHHGLRRHGPSQELLTIWFHLNLLSPGLCLATPTSFTVVSFFSGSLIVSFFVGLSCFCLCYFSEVLILKFTLFCCSWFLFSCV